MPANSCQLLSENVARSSSDDSRIRYILPVLWTSCFPTVGPYKAWRWQYRRQRHAKARSQNSHPTYLPECATLIDFVVVYKGSKLRTGGEVWCLRLLWVKFSVIIIIIIIIITGIFKVA